MGAVKSTSTGKVFRVKPEYLGLVAWTAAPKYERAEGGKFTLDDNLSQKDMGYLFEVIEYPGIEAV